MTTSFQTVTLHYLVKLIGCKYSEALGAMKALGCTGQMVSGERVWTREQVEEIRAYLAK